MTQVAARSVSSTTPARTPLGVLHRLTPYVAIARPDHWFKNVFMMLGVLLAGFYHPQRLADPGIVVAIAWAVLATCLLASSNYVLNEILDAPTDRSHPVKRHRPIPAARAMRSIAYVEWLCLAAAGLLMAFAMNRAFFYTAVSFLVMGLIYNVPPLRAKDQAFVDVLTESVNNPIRLMLGWFTLSATDIPPVSLLIAYWMIGAFFMASKRVAEYRFIADPIAAVAYRRSFRHYTQEMLLCSIVFYVTLFALFLGIFIVRYHLELILLVPLIAGLVGYYLHIAFKQGSCAQNPERLYRETGLMIYLATLLLLFIGLMFVQVPLLYRLFNVEPSAVPPLWHL